MEKYLNQLLEDILAAHKSENEANYSKNESIEAHFADVERYLSGDYDQILADVVGLNKEQFPPVEMLTENQMKLLTDALDKMLFSYNISTDLPDGLPINIAYSLMVSVLDRDIYIGNGDGHIGIEFCHYEPQSCPFGDKFCSCKDYDNGIDEIKKANQGNEDSLF
ncbi:MAG: hypothetical protein MUE53_06385 [Chitinophagales bacterium]|jgi:hypothetical protein|nr:hypothetical protein [Chitinophagales bacterium]